MRLDMHPAFEMASWLWQCSVAVQNLLCTLNCHAANQQVLCVMLHCFCKPAMPNLPSSLNMRV